MLVHRSGAVYVLAAISLHASVVAAFLTTTPFPAKSSVFGLQARCSQKSSLQSWSMALAAPTKTKKSALQKALQKPSGALTVSLEYTHRADKSQLEREILSCQLRKEKVASLWVDRHTLSDFAREQAAAKGDFPGPCPVVLREPVKSKEDLDFVRQSGACAVVIDAEGDNAAELAQEAEQLSLTPVWEVQNKDEVDKACEAGGIVFLVSAETMKEDESLVRELPNKSVWVAKIASMQPKNMEIDHSRTMKELGCKAMLVSEACVGDEEDLAYARWVVAEMSSKASSEFKITGMTGHVNGHYGTGTFEKSNSDTMWKRASSE